MTLTAIVIWGGVALVGAVMIGGIVLAEHHKRRGGPRQQRGSEPGQGDILVFAGESAGLGNPGNADATGRVIRVTKDPQQYAKAFVPSNRSDKQ